MGSNSASAVLFRNSTFQPRFHIRFIAILRPVVKSICLRMEGRNQRCPGLSEVRGKGQMSDVRCRNVGERQMSDVRCPMSEGKDRCPMSERATDQRSEVNGKSFDAVYHREHPPGFRWLHESFRDKLEDDGDAGGDRPGSASEASGVVDFAKEERGGSHGRFFANTRSASDHSAARD